MKLNVLRSTCCAYYILCLLTFAIIERRDKLHRLNEPRFVLLVRLEGPALDEPISSRQLHISIPPRFFSKEIEPFARSEREGLEPIMTRSVDELGETGEIQGCYKPMLFCFFTILIFCKDKFRFINTISIKLTCWMCP